MNVFNSKLIIINRYLTGPFDFSNPSYLEDVARVVFGEAQGEIYTGQVAVAYTIVNRVSHRGYTPNTVIGVIQDTYDGGHQYNTLDITDHDSAWEAAKEASSSEYTTAIKASRAALCGCEVDPTVCATDFCSEDPCSATESNIYWTAVHKIRIGNHYFVCRVEP